MAGLAADVTEEALVGIAAPVHKEKVAVLARGDASMQLGEVGRAVESGTHEVAGGLRLPARVSVVEARADASACVPR